MSGSFAIEAQGLGKRYRLNAHRRPPGSLRELAGHALSGAAWRRWRESSGDHFWALRDASFSIAHGENVGFIGLNGAGKSTALKILSRITEPTTGRVRIRGRLGALLEVGTGFHGDLTGRENVYLYGSILGMKKEEVRRKFDAIVEFSEIGAFIDTPVKRYSSGMYVRLAFAVAANLEPDILLLDEVLAVGDLPFQRKCVEFAKNLQHRNATILFVSHNMSSIKTMCDRVIYLRKGSIAYDGPTEKGISMYEEDSRLTSFSRRFSDPAEMPIRATDIRLEDSRQGGERTVFARGESLKIVVAFEARRPIERPNFIVAVVRSDGVICCNYASEADGLDLGRVDGKGRIEITTPPLLLTSDSYRINLIVREAGYGEALCEQTGTTFHVKDDLFDRHFGVFHEPARWRVEPAAPRSQRTATQDEA